MDSHRENTRRDFTRRVALPDPMSRWKDYNALRILETAQPQAHCPPAINCLLSCPPIKDSLPSNALTPVTRSGAADCSIRCFSEAS
ncbi:hypothetical protein HZH66_001571 [Vespula vulgaris]|nr:hypothetical protein HZH66_001571 [Vespula vulgaris]